jgi:C1A family cysteine protease
MKSAAQYAQIDISEQQIIDCSSSYGNNGCNGGWIENVLKYQTTNGVTTEAAYPYTQTSGSCKVNGGAFKISSYSGGALADCNALAAMVTGRPTSIAVSAGNNYWMNYAGGILNQCGTGIDHGVLLVGVFQNATQNYWKVKNSWGASWGEKGFIRIDRNLNGGNLCDICGYGYYPIV